jgi:hypothetical protein
LDLLGIDMPGAPAFMGKQGKMGGREAMLWNLPNNQESKMF